MKQPQPSGQPEIATLSARNSSEARSTNRISVNVLLSNRGQETRDENSEMRRRMPGVWAMALIGMLAYYVLRSQYDSLAAMGVESAIGAVLLLVLRWASPGNRNPVDADADQRALTFSAEAGTRGVREPMSVWAILTAGICVTFAFMLDYVFRRMGAGNGHEILMLACLGWGAMALAAIAPSLRVQSLSPIASGFLVLFSTFISDEGSIVGFVYVWIAVCLWWLLNNHWSTVQCLSATQVTRSNTARWSYLLLAVGLFFCVTVVASDRLPVLRKLKTEVMPTSGGTSQKDSAARSGVGNGDALVAAKNHAASFGPVETDIFLDSEKPSLFDVFSDEFGDPKKKKRVERAQALNPNDIQSNEGNFSEANRSSGGNEFSIEREPPKTLPRTEDLHANSLMYWEGPTGVRLAAKRFETFDGTAWIHADSEKEDSLFSGRKTLSLEAVEIEDRTWFLPKSKAIQNSISPFVDTTQEALKFTRYRSPEIPIRAGTQMWSIDQLTLADFFGYEKNDCLFMPGRLHVPDYTVVRIVGSRIDQERVESLARNCSPGKPHRMKNDQCQSEIAQLAHEFAADAPRGIEQIENVIDGLRSSFEWSREMPSGDDGALEAFLNSKRGPSYMFATASALMLDHLGYETRLASGFYVSPERYVASERATAILPEDAHVWTEIHVGHGYWIPLEPTPGFRKPRLKVGIWYLAQKNWKSIVGCSVALIVSLIAIYWARALLFAGFCWAMEPVLRMMPTRRRLSWLCWMLDMRWSLIGVPRKASQTQRKRLNESGWGLETQAQQMLSKFLDVVDSVRYGSAQQLTVEQRAISHLASKYIHRIRVPKSTY